MLPFELYCDPDKLLGSISSWIMNCSAGWKRRWRHCCQQSSGPFVDGVCGKLPVNIWNLPGYPFADWRTDSRCVERKLTLGIVRSCRFNCSARSSYKLQGQMLRSIATLACLLLVCLSACLSFWFGCLTKLNWTELTETEVCQLAQLSTARLPVGLHSRAGSINNFDNRTRSMQ
jgi:hypothetical protein